MSARFEIVRTDAGWHSRFRAKNGRIVWVTESYTRRKPAERAVAQLGAADWRRGFLCWVHLATHLNDRVLEVREVDERGAS